MSNADLSLKKKHKSKKSTTSNSYLVFRKTYQVPKAKNADDDLKDPVANKTNNVTYPLEEETVNM